MWMAEDIHHETEQDLSEDAFLGGRISLLQPRHGYRAATDAVFLAAACPAKAGQSVLDLGCGVGAASLCLGYRVDVSLTGIEIQAAYAELARQNAERNRIPMTVECSDLTAMPDHLRVRSFDHVMLNPPFFPPGKAAKDPGRAIARLEDTPLSDWIDVALKRVAPRGYITLIHMVEKLAQVLALLQPKAGQFEIKPLCAREGHPPKRFVLRARKGAASVTKLCSPLILHKGAHHITDRDDFTQSAKAILRDSQPLEF